MSDPEFSRAFVAAYERMPQWRKDQFDAYMRDAVEVINRVAKAMADWGTAGVEAAEKHANGETE
jgi:hypothetical protein